MCARGAWARVRAYMHALAGQASTREARVSLTAVWSSRRHNLTPPHPPTSPNALPYPLLYLEQVNRAAAATKLLKVRAREVWNTCGPES